MNIYSIGSAKYFLMEPNNIPKASFARLSQISHCNEIQALPATERICKRTSRLSRSVINHLVYYYDDYKYDYVVFASRFGELEFIEINNEANTIAEELSPVVFSHSVHNAISCLYSIINKNQAPSISLSITEGAFSTAIVEAAAYLESTPGASNVLVVCYDGYLPDRYLSFCGNTLSGYVMSFTVSRNGSGYQLKDLVDKFAEANDDICSVEVLNSICNA